MQFFFTLVKLKIMSASQIVRSRDPKTELQFKLYDESRNTLKYIIKVTTAGRCNDLNIYSSLQKCRNIIILRFCS